MGRSFADDLRDDTAVFLNSQEFGQEWVHIPAEGGEEPFIGVLEEREPQPLKNSSGGSVVQRTGLLTCPLTLSVNCDGGQRSSRFRHQGIVWLATGKRSDEQCQEVLVVAHTAIRLKAGFPGNTP